MKALEETKRRNRGQARDGVANLDVFGKGVITRLHRSAVAADGLALTARAFRTAG